MKKILITLITFLLIFFFLFGIYKFDTYSEKAWDKRLAINIPFWTPTQEVAQILKDKGLISRKWTMLLYIKLSNLEWKIQAWDYIIKHPINLKNLVETLQNNKQEEMRIIIPEWSTIKDIDKILASKNLITPWDIIKCASECTFPEHNFFFDGNLEWYLFPDTYFVPILNFSPSSFLKRMLNNFQKKILTDSFTETYKKTWKSLSDIIIMASIIEREERDRANMPIISWILWKRLNEGIPLWADATTRYYKNDKTWDLNKQDFKENNPYNSRIIKWLPPTAISNPGLSAINASVKPEKSEYYYYLHDSEGNIHYSKTNEEHNYNRLKFIK